MATITQLNVTQNPLIYSGQPMLERGQIFGGTSVQSVPPANILIDRSFNGYVNSIAHAQTVVQQGANYGSTTASALFRWFVQTYGKFVGGLAGLPQFKAADRQMYVLAGKVNYDVRVVPTLAQTGGSTTGTISTHPTQYEPAQVAQFQGVFIG